MTYFIHENLDEISVPVEVSKCVFELFKRYCCARKGRTWCVFEGCHYSSNVPSDSLVLSQIQILKVPKL